MSRRKRQVVRQRSLAAGPEDGIRQIADTVWVAEPGEVGELVAPAGDVPAGQGRDLERWRERAGLTIAQAAGAFGVVPQTWYRWIGGATVPDRRTRARLDAAIERQRLVWRRR